MNIVPIVFAFDNHLLMPACICLSSLMMNAKQETFYDVFILHSEKEVLDKKMLGRVETTYSNCRIQYRIVDNCFDKAFEIRGITHVTYYRLLIPELIPEYDKIIYSDVDVIFRLDLAELYQLNLGGNYLAATYDLGMNLESDGQKYIQTMPELHQGEYIQAGFIILNSKAIRDDNLTTLFKKEAKRKLKFQDQDILNIVCSKRIMIIPWKYNMTDYSFSYIYSNPEALTDKYANTDILEAVSSGNLHYNGHKPWKKYAINFDIWWEYYRKSPFYDAQFYFDFFNRRLYLLDTLTLWKRIKTVIRFFTVGRTR